MSATGTEWSATRPLMWGFLTVALLFGGLGTWSVFTTLAGAIIALNRLLDLSTLWALASVAGFALLAPLIDRTLIADIILLGGTKRNYAPKEGASS